ncbi:hypothetical protein G6F46_008160 [Rhizopus delemar]|uniref:BHLH domain-containing protein n=3 Tax=Rhizopus TaxID=4842 RepID=I1CJK2_RHIO9|nr:hypothetical protein RO3G_13343 [Rhizopus delemar RA 99-880]KAG1448445.1 hypothetical protein G6F55_010647 [Rhizopus delemar]KAG1535847.1 hypothetical protein G6F51_011309 [Rhizopus arrhizus]KAG1501497.1 hypothetical protein G6F53_011068 [Rhizopus delemar]KAG1501790.1 hypothetical protein G6F54_002804 [Rhizopus delemar]|eukprot:EIE88632.1 hypothetical protein RO3G_13343 [Rhizopus delemar RA 99-880]
MEYHPSNKASSVTSITSYSSSSTDTSSIWDSIYIGRADSISTFEQDDILLPDSDEGFTFQSLSSNPDDHENKKNKSKRSSLLSEEQRRANHIASEKKRRNMIRGGFRELTELVPTLKNINNSKSVILFKSFEYIQHLEKRNSQLKKTLLQLQKKVNQKQARKMSYTSISIPNDIIHKNTYNAPALVMPVSVDSWFHNQSITPSFNIPAMDNDHFIIHGRESLLSSGKLNHLKQTK